MKYINKKCFLVIIAIMMSLILLGNNAFAESSSVEISGEGIYYIEGSDDVNGFYYCNKYLSVGEKFKIKAEQVVYDDTQLGKKKEISRKDVTDTSIWLSSDENIIKVEKGVIEGVSEGRAEIMVSYNGKSTSFFISVGEPIEIEIGAGIYITQKDEIKSIKQGDKLQLDVNTIEMSSIKNEKATWSSSNEKVATVDSKGIVTAVGVGKVNIKAEFGKYNDIYEISVTEKHNIKLGYENYDISINKKQINLNISDSDKIEITANLQEGYDIIALYEEITDNWDVEWKVEDESIVECIPEKGIVNNLHGITQTVGKASIKGIKEGNTQILIKVKIAENQFKEFSIPIVVNSEEKNDPGEKQKEEPKDKEDDKQKEEPKDKEDDKQKDEKKDKQEDGKNEDSKVDNSIADKNLPKTGENNFVIVGMIVIMLIGAMFIGMFFGTPSKNR